MKDFKSYKPKEENEGQPRQNINPNGAKSANDINATVDLAKAISQAFNGKSQGDIFKTILAQAEQGKRNGTLTNADLDNFYNALYPLLDGLKRQKLKQIITKLKSI